MSDLEYVGGATHTEQERVRIFPGRVLVARRGEPARSEHTDLSNVVPFARVHRKDAETEFLLPTITAQDRPALASPGAGLARRSGMLAASLLLHAALLAMFWNAPVPVAGIGGDIISVEVTLGATTAAGLANAPGEQETQVATPAEEQRAEEVPSQQTAIATAMPQEVPVSAQETAPEVKEQQPDALTAEQRPQEQQAEISTEAQPQIKTAVIAEERRRIDAPTQKDAEKTQQSAAAAPTDAASGVGRGRSEVAANYNGTVAIHLARHKQYPAAARQAGAQGIATVSFSLDSGGRVTSVALVRASGIPAIDQEVMAMVRRASPFPAPPDGQGRNFTVPVRFNLR